MHSQQLLSFSVVSLTGPTEARVNIHMLTGHTIIPVLTDFAGTEAPLWAMKELGLHYRHVGASDLSTGPQKYIFRNHAPEKFWPDVLQRPSHDLDALPVGAHPMCKSAADLPAVVQQTNPYIKQMLHVFLPSGIYLVRLSQP